MNNLLKSLLLTFCVSMLLLKTQAAEVVTKEFITQHLKTNIYPIDSGAEAVILYENEYSSITIDEGRWLCKTIVHKVVKILKPEALDLGNVSIYYSEENYRDNLANVQGTTYNLNGDSVVAIQITRKELLKKVLEDDVRSVSFSLPAVKIGSVIDYSYEVTTGNFSSLYIWHIQGKYPKLNSIYSLVYPKFLEFTAITHLTPRSSEFEAEGVAESSTDSFGHVLKNYDKTLKAFWVRHNVPPFKEEPFMNNTENNKERLEMQISSFKNNVFPKAFCKNWQALNSQLWKEEGLHNQIEFPNIYFNRVLDTLLKPAMSDHDKVVKIFKYIRNNFECRQAHWTGRYHNIDLKKIWNERKGNIDEVNALLVSMLRSAGFNAHPIVMSTTEYVSPNQIMPVIDRLIYLACVVDLDGGSMLLDASDKNYPAGFFPPECYNGYSWILGDTGRGVDLVPDMIREKNLTSVRVSDFTDETAQIQITHKLGTTSSTAFRLLWPKEKDKQKEYLDNFKHQCPGEIDIKEIVAENVGIPDTSIIIKISGTFKLEKSGENIYLPTAFLKLYDKNPFPATHRQFPIELSSCTDRRYYLSVILPDDLAPDTLSQPMAIDYGEGDISYRRNAAFLPEVKTLTLNSTFAINSTFYGAEEYESLRNYYQKMLEDYNQIIVLKKKPK